MALLLSLAVACRDQPSASRPAAARPARSAELTPLQTAYQFLDDLVQAPPPADLLAGLRVVFRGGLPLNDTQRAANARGWVVVNLARDEESALRYRLFEALSDGTIGFLVFETPADARHYFDRAFDLDVAAGYINMRDRFAFPDSRHPSECITHTTTHLVPMAGSMCNMLLDTVVVWARWLQSGDEPRGTEDQAILLARQGSAHIEALQAAAARRAATSPARPVLRLGWLSVADVSAFAGPRGEFLRRMEELGYHRGQDLFLDYRFADGHPDRLLALALELVADGVDQLVVDDFVTARVAMRATRTIPIVVLNSQDPVAEGLAASVAHPGGNITGVIAEEPHEIFGKRLEILADAFPELRRVAVVAARPDQPGWVDLERVARARGIELVRVWVVTDADVDGALETITHAHVQAVLVFLPACCLGEASFGPRFDPLNRRSLHLPYMTPGLDSTPVVYTARWDARFRRAADFVDRIRGGVAPADLPFERPAVFKLSVDLRTARDWGLEIAPALVAQADEVWR